MDEVPEFDTTGAAYEHLIDSLFMGDEEDEKNERDCDE